MVKLKKGVELIYGRREYASEAIGGFIIAVMTIFFASFGFGLDLLFSFIGLIVLVPVYKFIFNWFLFEFQSSLKYIGIKYLSGVATIAFVAVMEIIDPAFIVFTLFGAILLYIFMDDILSIVRDYTGGVTW